MRDTERARGRDTGRGRSSLHTGSPMWDLILGFQDHAPRPKAGVKLLSHPGIGLQPRAWSWRPRIESHVGLPAWSPLLPLPVSLPLALSFSLSLCPSWVNNTIFWKTEMNLWSCVHIILDICVTKFEAIVQGRTYSAVSISDNPSLDLRVGVPSFRSML